MNEPENTTSPCYPWQTNIWQQFCLAKQNNHLPHALLLHGGEHTGKLKFANSVVKSLLCENSLLRENSLLCENNGEADNMKDQDICEACHQCRSCKTYGAGSNPDYLSIDLIEDKQQISIDQIRAMNAFLTLSRSFNTYRVVLISNAERMNKNAANGLLKSLEEPANNSVIILLTSQASVLLPTIKSRCQILQLPTPHQQQAIEWLQQQTGKDSQFKQELDIAQGKPLAALEVDDELINLRADLLNDILNIIHEKSSIIDIAKKWQKQDRGRLIDWQIGWISMLLSAQYKSNRQDQVDEKLGQLNDNILVQSSWDLYDQLLKQKKIVHTSVNPLIFIENMLTLWLGLRSK